MYVGKTVRHRQRPRLLEHRRERKEPDIQMVEVCHTNDEGRWSEREHIALMRSLGQALPWNKNEGGGGPPQGGVGWSAGLSCPQLSHPCSADTKQALREHQTGKTATAETRAKMSASHSGKTVTNETKAKMSASLIGNTRNLGHKDNDETRALKSSAKTAYWAEWRAKRHSGIQQERTVD